MRPIQRRWLGLLVAMLVSVGFAAGVVADRLWLAPAPLVSAGGVATGATGDAASAAANELDVFNDVWKMVQDQYYYQPIDRARVVQAAIKGLVGALEDENSRYLTPDESSGTRSQMQGYFEGIGVWLDTDDGRLRIIAPMDNSPAQRAGVQPNDVIVIIDGRDVVGMKVDDALKLVRGKAGTSVRLGLRRLGGAEVIEIAVERAKIEVDAVTYRRLDDNIGYVRATVFGDKTTDQLDAALKDLQRQGVRAIVLDLRNNGGGWVSAAREMVGRFVPDGTALVEVSRAGERVDPVLTSADTQMYTTPLVVLVNGGSASASEIVAGALQDRGRATLIGERTFGKGSIQQVREFRDSSSVRLTTAQWLTPAKRVIEKRGIMPDVVIGPEGEPADDLLRAAQRQTRLPRALGPANPDGRLGPPDYQLERARQFILTGK
ncbi:MAG: S41 family peptidase [Chloroflexi bacterium]|nr:S41 family peptidase [Chloroflexota bacterium]